MRRRLGIILSLSISSVTFANAGWPAAWVVGASAAATKQFWILVAISLVIEDVLLHRLTKLSWVNATLACILANSISAAVGFLLTVPFMYVDGLALRVTENFRNKELLMRVYLPFLGIVFFAISVLIEVLIVSTLWKVPQKIALRSLFAANLVTYALGIWFIFHSI